MFLVKSCSSFRVTILFEFRGIGGRNSCAHALTFELSLCYYYYLKHVRVSDIKIPPSLTKYSFPRLIFEVSYVSHEQKRHTAICFKFMRVRCYITITQRNCERGKAFIVSCWLSSRRLDRRIKKTDNIANSRYTLYSEML